MLSLVRGETFTVVFSTGETSVACSYVVTMGSEERDDELEIEATLTA